MKELSIEEKAKAYDLALERAKDALSDGTISNNTIAYLQSIFPELKESEDENFIGCVVCIYQDSCSSLQFGQGCTDGKEVNRG